MVVGCWLLLPTGHPHYNCRLPGVTAPLIDHSSVLWSQMLLSYKTHGKAFTRPFSKHQWNKEKANSTEWSSCQPVLRVSHSFSTLRVSTIFLSHRAPCHQSPNLILFKFPICRPTCLQSPMSQWKSVPQTVSFPNKVNKLVCSMKSWKDFISTLFFRISVNKTAAQ
jgi:hypothetical protein